MPPASNTKDPQWNVFQRLVFSWMVPIVWMARKSTLALGNLPLPLTHHTSAAHASFASAWDAHVSSCSTTHPDSTKQSPKAKQPSLLHVLWSQYWRNLLVAGLFKAGWSVLVIFGAYFFVRSILIYVTDQPPFDEVWKGWVLTAFFWLDAWLLGMGLFGWWVYSWGGVRCMHVLFTSVNVHQHTCHSGPMPSTCHTPTSFSSSSSSHPPTSPSYQQVYACSVLGLHASMWVSRFVLP